jgi:formylglycine-generating enzyme required for sulfatase activity
MNCPICDSEIDEKYDYCRKCAWEFEYYFDELSEEERERYSYRFDVYKKIYQKSISKQNIVYEKKISIKNNGEIIVINGLMYQNQPFVKRYTWEEAKEYAEKLKLGDFNDWKLPTIDELKNILTHNRNKGKNGRYYIRKEFIDNLEGNGWFWSNTEPKEYPSYAWNTNFKNANNALEHKGNKFFVLCVR